MMLGYQCEVIEDTKKRKLLVNKKTNVGYLLPEKGEAMVHIFKMGVFYCAAVAILIGYFLNLAFYFYVAIGAVLYVLLLLYYNKTYIPSLTVVKKFERKKEIKKKDKATFPFVALGYLAVGLGLAYCLYTGDVEEGVMTYVVIGGIALCAFNVIFYLQGYIRER